MEDSPHDFQLEDVIFHYTDALFEGEGEEEETDTQSEGTPDGVVSAPHPLGWVVQAAKGGSTRHSEVTHQSTELPAYWQENLMHRTVFLRGISLYSSQHHYRQYLDQFGTVLRVRVCVPEALKRALWEEKKNGRRNEPAKGKRETQFCYSFVEYADLESAARCLHATDGISNRFDGSLPSRPTAPHHKVACSFPRQPITGTMEIDAVFRLRDRRRSGKKGTTTGGKPLSSVVVVRECLFGAVDPKYTLKDFITNEHVQHRLPLLKHKHPIRTAHRRLSCERKTRMSCYPPTARVGVMGRTAVVAVSVGTGRPAKRGNCRTAVPPSPPAAAAVVPTQPLR
ncbi:hypothetical protein AGDE_15753 [Angomonas deanei]|uniref:RNA recognition motif. (A.k.a. RRM, RBD, or RNP domain) n=1 Tax=Angomonas deanei TaxID=59799 RepID=A0A7G2C2M8_9TRYP|nr:hypothetical protein AGDE_15753 [Angomonas deanei]CAD2213909.1 hypothetical protein, conserved [Angomonas deanei]|eukprot:EPY18533.1 hypothetical protein AGDE_15753 [Angomonas deanei]